MNTQTTEVFPLEKIPTRKSEELAPKQNVPLKKSSPQSSIQSEISFKQLEENILNDGEIRDPIITWNGVIVDGHNRWKVIQANSWLTYKVKEMDFADK